jgi:hypothetical protein
MSAWKVQAARITVFPLLASGAVPRSALELYKAVWGKEPDSFQNQNPVGSPFPNSVAQGLTGKITRLCQTQPIRADFTFGPAGGPLNVAAVPVIEDTDLLSIEMKGLVGAVEGAFQQTALNRVAVYIQCGQEAADITSANQIISGSLWANQKVTLTDEEDFVLQINRKRLDSLDPSLKLNFITKWSVERLQMLMFSNAQMAAGGPTVTEIIMPTVTLDNSNMPLQKPLAAKETERVLSELLQGMAAQLKQCNISIKGF